MKRIALILLLMGSFGSYSQNLMDSILISIERNNSSLIALRASLDAEMLGSSVGLLPPDPEVEIGFLEGSPAVIGNRTDFSVTQSFDFPTSYLYRHQIASLQLEQLETVFLHQKSEILQQARQFCAELTYQNTLFEENSKRASNARKLLDAYAFKYEHGACNLIEYQKVQINFLTISKEVEKIEIHRQFLLSELARLNGGKPIRFDEKQLISPALLPDFEVWFAQMEKSIPEIVILKQESQIREKQVQLQRSLNLPKFSAGYRSETVVGQAYHGVSVGISVPVWENRNKLRLSKAMSSAVNLQLSNTKMQLKSELDARYSQVLALEKSINEYRSHLLVFSNDELLNKALDMGEISLIDYFIGLSDYYESYDNLLEMEYNLQLAYAELLKFSMIRQ